jgi:aminopeptidase N
MYQIVLLATCFLIGNVHCDENYRLITPISPSAYSIAITPYFDTGDAKAFTFDGEVNITITTTEVIKQIKLHSENLTFTANDVQVTYDCVQLTLDETNPLEFDTFYTFAHINLQNELQVGMEYVVHISYRGPIREDLFGFYRNYYKENGVKK